VTYSILGLDERIVDSNDLDVIVLDTELMVSRTYGPESLHSRVAVHLGMR
jgi:hypothetical protein